MKIDPHHLERIKKNIRKPCEYCDAKKEMVILQRVIMANGHTHVAWICTSCHRYARRSNQWIGYDILEIWIQHNKIPPIDELPIFADKRTDEIQCFVCGHLGAELHHFAPTSLKNYFGNVELWPKEYLCDEHHKLWHSILTPWMPSVSTSDIAVEILRKYYTQKGVST